MTIKQQAARVLFLILKEKADVKELDKEIKSLDYPVWQALCQAVLDKGIFPLFYDKLTALKLKSFPSEFLHQFKEAYLLNLQKNLLYEKEFLKIASHLRKFNIEIMALKGPIFARLFYQDMGLRNAPVDLDILIKEENLAQAQGVLKELGYSHLQIEHKRDFLQSSRFARQVYQFCLKKKNQDSFGVCLDIHTSIRGFCKQNQIHELWQQARYIKLGQNDILMLSNEDLLLYLSVISISLLEFVQLRYLYDIHRLVTVCQELDWDKLLYKVKDCNLSACFYFPLFLSNTIFGSSIPAQVLNSCKPSFMQKRLIDLYINEERILSMEHKDFSRLERLLISRYLYSKNWAEFFNKALTRKKVFSLKGG